MQSFPAVAASSPNSLKFLRRSSRFSLSNIPLSNTPLPTSSPPVRSKYGGVQLHETVEPNSPKSRLDAWISSRMADISRARIQSSIKSGLVSVNGRSIHKVSHMIKGGDVVSCTVSELQPLKAEAEEIPLDIVYEDDHLLVVNKPPHMVVHPAPGNPNGTLVNAILHHCKISTFTFLTNNQDELNDDSSSDEGEISVFHVDKIPQEIMSHATRNAVIRPGIVHRLDKGTSGLLVVAKDEEAHSKLAEQFKVRTIKRVYVSLTAGVPRPGAGRIEMPIGRDPGNRLRMVATSNFKNGQARFAASRYKVMEVFSGGGCALVEWRLETGRTHQIRAHAKYLGVPLLGDEVYGGTKSMAMSLLRAKVSYKFHENISEMLTKLDRPCLHALSLGFKHPQTGEFLEFSRPPPDDFSQVLDLLRSIIENENE
ncbi:hypothetical protein LUZ60_007098 [Juncus effusus]|nr:hypothetical protein LUZ60_007098 [Juncus effusus]